MAKHIGIVAVSPEGSALCYREIFRYATRMIGPTGHPKVTLHNERFEDYVSAVLRDDWHAVGALLQQSAKILAAAGADFCIVPDNLMQHGVHIADVGSPIPWLTMTDLVAEAVARDQRKTVGLIGTKMVMLGSTYQTHLGLRGARVLIPSTEDAQEVDRIIFRELVYGVVNPVSQSKLVEVVGKLGDSGCEGVILGCSEAPLVIGASNSPLPVYDPTALLAEGAVACAIGKRSVGGGLAGGSGI